MRRFLLLSLLFSSQLQAGECVNHSFLLKTEVIPDSIEVLVSVTQFRIGVFSFFYDNSLSSWVFREADKRIGFYDQIKKTWSSFELGDTRIVMGEKSSESSILNLDSVEGIYGTYSKFRKALERNSNSFKTKPKQNSKAAPSVNPFAALSSKDYQVNILADAQVENDPMENTQMGKIESKTWNAGILEISNKKNSSKLRITSSVGAEDFPSDDGMGYKRYPLQGYQVVSFLDAKGTEKSSLRVLRPLRLTPKEEKKADLLELKDKYFFTIGCGRLTELSNSRSPNSVKNLKKK